MVKDQLITDRYAIYNTDNMYLLPTIPDGSIHLSIDSPPFKGLYKYSSSENDLSNCETPEQFLEQYEFMVRETARVMMPGRIVAVHVTDIMDSKRGKLSDFPHEVIQLHEKYGLEYRNRITIWKEPLKVRMRTMVRSLMHKLIVEDSTECFTAMPDYVLIFKKKGVNPIPVTHPVGLTEYFGETPMLPAMEEAYGSFEALKKKYAGWKDPKTNKLSHIIWQRYASSVWDDVRIDNVLPFRDCKEEDDEKHVHPLQLDVNDRLVEMYSNPDEVILTKFLGVGSEAYSAVSLGRRAIGTELKEAYYKQSVINMQQCKERFKDNSQLSLI
jgi:DNA modification methylase